MEFENLVGQSVTWDDDAQAFPQRMTILDIDEYGFTYNIQFVSGRTEWVDSAELRLI